MENSIDMKQCKIVSVYICEPQKRMPCIAKGLVCRILNCTDVNSIEVETIKGKITSFHTLDELKQLVAREDLGNRCHNQKGCDCWDDDKHKCGSFRPTSIDYQLWYEQWQSAIDGKDVNSNKNITFEVMGTPFEEGSQHSQCVATNKWKLAKIIPA